MILVYAWVHQSLYLCKCIYSTIRVNPTLTIIIQCANFIRTVPLRMVILAS